VDLEDFLALLIVEQAPTPGRFKELALAILAENSEGFQR